MNTEEKVKTIVASIFNKDVNEITIDSSPDNIEEWDSVMHINLVLALEEEFGIKFNDEQILEMMNVSLIIYTINEVTA
jgi:acyl carrier protein